MTSPKSTSSSASTESGSFESWLQGRRAALQEQHPCTLPVPGFQGRVIGEYHNPNWKGLRTLGVREQDKPNSTLDEADIDLLGFADVLINACDRLYGKGEDGSEVELPTWGVELARKFGITDTYINTPRRAVLAIFQGQEINLVKHAGDVLAGTQVIDEDIDQELAENLPETGE